MTNTRRVVTVCLCLPSGILTGAFGFAAGNVGPVDLHFPHPSMTPADVLSSLSQSCKELGIDEFDVYGDFMGDYNKDPSESYLRRFEKEVAMEFGKEDALFLPSGTMAQSIALLIHARAEVEHGQKKKFLCHHTSHLLLHENEGYKRLLQMEPVIISTEGKIGENGLSVPPMRLQDVRETFDTLQDDISDVAAMIIELPHRELGGKLTPWEEIEEIASLCQQKNIQLHCDGARIFEAGAGYGMSLPDVAKPFDSVYVSFYKGLGAISGAMLLGDKYFISEARIWLRRFGGNLYTLLPYAVSSWAGYRLHVHPGNERMTFAQKREKMVRLARMLSDDKDISSILLFDPPVPETNMVHGYLRPSQEECDWAIRKVLSERNIKVLRRVRSTSKPVDTAKYKSQFEWTIGDANGCIKDEVFLEAWRLFARLVKGGCVDELPSHNSKLIRSPTDNGVSDTENSEA